MKTESILLFGIIVCGAVSIMIVLNFLMPDSASARTPRNKPENPKRRPVQLYAKKDDNPERTAKLAKEIFGLCPPLRFDRLKRRMKMLWGIDLNDYPADGLIVLAGDLEAPKDYGSEGYGDETGSFVLAPKHGLIWMQTYTNSGMWGDLVPASFPPEKYALFYRYLMMSDTEALRKYFGEYEETFREVDFTSTIDFMEAAYSGALFDAGKTTFEYRDKSGRVFLQSGKMSDLRLDAFHLFFASERKKGRIVYIYDSQRPFTEISGALKLEEKKNMGEDGFIFFDYDDSVKTEWPVYLYPNLISGRSIAAWFSAHLRYRMEGMDNMIVKCLYDKNYYTSFKNKTENRETFKKNLKSNNYYGYTLLRDFCENPMREMPVLEKIGASFRANVKENNTLLYLEPFADSYDIDTVQPTEFLKACEMGHDDYYFIEVEKPVESPVAGPDGYAMILDRTETVYGYIPKKQVKPLTDADILQWETTRDTTMCKKGLVNDPDGYVNIRREQNAKSEIVGRIAEKEAFRYWDLPTNWRVVETETGLRGFVYKDRVKEKINAGGWILE